MVVRAGRVSCISFYFILLDCVPMFACTVVLGSCVLAFVYCIPFPSIARGNDIDLNTIHRHGNGNDSRIQVADLVVCSTFLHIQA